MAFSNITKDGEKCLISGYLFRGRIVLSVQVTGFCSSTIQARVVPVTEDFLDNLLLDSFEESDFLEEEDDD